MAATTERRTRRSRGSIDAEMILRGAFEVARRDGLDGMSMPSLAAHLKVGVTSIYWYFRSKEDLLHQMYLRAAGSLDDRIVKADGVDPADWRPHLLQVFGQIRAAYAEDDVMAELLLHRHGGRAAGGREEFLSVYEGLEGELALMVAAGFPLVEAWRVYSALWMFTFGTATNERARKMTGYPPLGTAQLSMIDVDRTPLLGRLVTDHGASVDMTDLAGDGFVAGLNLILDSAAARLTLRP